MTTIAELEARIAEIEARFDVAPLAANPPVTIGELTDVPAPGSAILSAWTQEVTRRSMHRFATIAARDAAYPAAGAGDGAICYTADFGLMWTVIAGVWVAASPGRGRVAANVVTAAQGGFGTTPAAIATAVTYTFDGNRWVEIFASVPISIGATATVGITALLVAGVGTIGSCNLQLPTNGATGYAHMRWQGKVASGSKAVTITLAGNAGTVAHAAAASAPSLLSIVDLGI